MTSIDSILEKLITDIGNIKTSSAQNHHQMWFYTLEEARETLYDRLAEEAVEIEQYVTGPLMKQPKIFKALPLSKLKELMGMDNE